MSYAKRLTKNKKQLDLTFYHRRLFVFTIILVLFGLFMIYNASASDAYRDFSDRYYYLKHQAQWALLGILLMVVMSKIDYHRWQKLAFGAFVINLTLLLLVLIPGIGSRVQGASRWINIFGFVLQPSETMKLVTILYLSTWLKTKQTITKFLAIVGLPAILILLEPDLGTTFVFFSISLIVYFLSGVNMKPLLTVIGGALAAGVMFILTSDYRRNRLTSFFDPSKDPLGISYHVNQILIALASGGLFGVGLGQSRQKHHYLPEAPTDSIFAVLAEEFGFVGAAIFIFIFLYFIFLFFRIAQSTQDNYGKVLTASVGSYIALQFLLNLSALVALVPLTGIPLPFISYGGSSLLTNLIAIGIIINIAKKR